MHDEVRSANRAVWARWWDRKLKNNQQVIREVRRGNYEEVAKLIDCQFNDDHVASINY